MVAEGNLTSRLDLDSNDEIGQMAGTMNQTIAKLKESREELVNAEETSRTLFNAQLDSIITLDLFTGKWIDVNLEFVQSTGYSREEVIGRRSRDFNLFVDTGASQKLADEIKKFGEVRNMEMTFRSIDKQVEIAGAPADHLLTGVAGALHKFQVDVHPLTGKQIERNDAVELRIGLFRLARV